MKKTIVLIFILSMINFSSCTKLGESRSGGTRTSSGPDNLDYMQAPENAEFILVTSHDHNTDGYNHQASLLFKTIVENKSNGRVGVKIYPNGQLAASGKEGIDALMSGNIDIFKATDDLASYWTPANAFGLPYLFPNDRVAEAVLSDPEIVDAARKSIAEKYPQLKLVMIAASGGWRDFATTSKKQIKVPSDIKGLKIRTVPSQVQQELVTILGGSPTAMPYSEIYTSLSTGVVDGVKLSIVDIVNAKLHETLHYIILDNHAYLSAFWFINSDKLNSMPEDLQVIVLDAFEDMRNYLNSYPKHQQIQAYNDFRARGGVVYNPSEDELNMFVEQSKPVKDWLVEQYGEEVSPWIAKLEQKVNEHSKRIEGINNQLIN